MPPKPSAAALRRVSTGNVEFSSQSRACGIISPRAKLRAVSWIARCSSERSKSMVVPARCFRFGIRSRFAAVKPRRSEHRHLADHVVAREPGRLRAPGLGDHPPLHGGVELAEVDEA